MSITDVSPTTQLKVDEPNLHFARLAPDQVVARTAQALTERGMTAIVAETGEQAKAQALKLIPREAQVFTAQSMTTAHLGLVHELDETGHYRSVRKILKTMDRRSQMPEMRKIMSSQDIVVGSVQAITQDGIVLDASASGSQLPAYAAGAEKVIWIVGAQKIVKDIDEGLQRIYQYCLPLEDERTRQVYGVGSGVNKILIVNREHTPGRITVILVKENLGF